MFATSAQLTRAVLSEQVGVGGGVLYTRVVKAGWCWCWWHQWWPEGRSRALPEFLPHSQETHTLGKPQSHCRPPRQHHQHHNCPSCYPSHFSRILMRALTTFSDHQNEGSPGSRSRSSRAQLLCPSGILSATEQVSRVQALLS